MNTKYDLYSLGNALLDTECEVGIDFLKECKIDKGLMTLVDKDRRDYLLKKVQEFFSNNPDVSMYKQTCGGSAANSVIAFSDLGGKSFYSCKVASDKEGETYYKALADSSVDCISIDFKNLSEEISNCDTNKSSDGETEKTGQCIVFVTPDADRTMTTYLGISTNYSINEIQKNKLIQSEILYVEGYLVASVSARKAVEETLKIARKNNISISLTLSDPMIVSNFRDVFKTWMETKIDLIFCNKDEAYAFTESSDEESLREVCNKLRFFSKKIVITDGKNGCYLFDGDNYFDLKTRQVNAIDSNGAGDLFAGTFLWANIVAKYNFQKSAEMALEAATILVTQFGARLKKSQLIDLKKKF